MNMKLQVTFLALFLISVLSVSQGGNDSYLDTATIRASTCISNSTHCHCSLRSADPKSQCIKPVGDDSSRCKIGTCAAGYHCDCNTDDVCEKVSTVFYTVVGNSSPDEFDCTMGHKTVPRKIVGKTSDINIVAYRGFQLFINTEQIGFATTTDHNIFTAEIQSGDIMAVIAKRKASDVYGLKLRFLDLKGETRYVDENWYASDAYNASWLMSSFDPVQAGWQHPAIAQTISDASFDKDVPWMWSGTSETVYFRYVIPAM